MESSSRMVVGDGVMTSLTRAALRVDARGEDAHREVAVGDDADRMLGIVTTTSVPT